MADEGEANTAKYRAGFKGGPYFTNPVKEPRRPFVKAVTATNSSVRKEKGDIGGKVVDPWVYRK